MREKILQVQIRMILLGLAFGILLPGIAWSQQGVLEVPLPPYSVQSGIGFISGWFCNLPASDSITVRFDNGSPLPVPYGVSRADTIEVCGGSVNNGFGLPMNWGLLEAGLHQVEVFAGETLFASAEVWVDTLGVEFLEGKTATCTISDFPTQGQNTVLTWQQDAQNFFVQAGDGLPSPSPSIRSGIGFISGWFCNLPEGDSITVRFDDGPPLFVPYGASRADTAEVCGGTVNNGFGMPMNWNVLDGGLHTVELFAGDTMFASTGVWVSTLGVEFLQDEAATCTVTDFPETGLNTILTWQQNTQNFLIAAVEGPPSSAVIGAMGGTVTSHDGRLTLTFPPGAVTGDTPITITKAANAASSTVTDQEVYRLEPDGATFAVPVTAAYSIPMSAVVSEGEEPKEDQPDARLPLTLMALISTDGSVDVPTEIVTSEENGTITYTTTLTHFSDIVTTDKFEGDAILDSFAKDPQPLEEEFFVEMILIIDNFPGPFLNSSDIVVDLIHSRPEDFELEVSPEGFIVPVGDLEIQDPIIEYDDRAFSIYLQKFKCVEPKKGELVIKTDLGVGLTRQVKDEDGNVIDEETDFVSERFSIDTQINCQGGGGGGKDDGPRVDPDPPQGCAALESGVYKGDGGCEIDLLTVASGEDNTMVLGGLGKKETETFALDPDPKNKELGKFKSKSSNIFANGSFGNTCTLACSPPTSFSLECKKKLACTEKFTKKE